MDSSGPDVSGVHPGPAGSFVEFHHLLSLLKEPEEGSDSCTQQKESRQDQIRQLDIFFKKEKNERTNITGGTLEMNT
jgi:hypothetical protein